MVKAKAKKHIDYIDIIRIIASLFVVFMHTASTGLRENAVSSAGWYTLASLTSLAFCAVPLFFMITGYLLTTSDRTSDVKVLFKERLPRLIIPLLFWSVLYVIFDMIATDSLSITQFLKKMFLVIERPANVSLWFMYALIAFYLISPLLCAGLNSLDKNGRKLILSIIVIIEVICMAKTVFPGFSKYLNFETLNYLNFFDGYLASFILGWYLGKSDKKVSSIALWLLFLATLGSIVAGTLILSSRSGEYITSFQSQSSGFEILLAVCIFMLIKQSKIFNSKHIIKATNKLGQYTFPIYLMHNLLLLIIGSRIVIISAKGVIIQTILVYIICLLIAFLCSRIPILSYLACGLDKKNINVKKKRN